jgi:putative ABC transport system permease protein
MDSLAHNIRIALRSLLRNPAVLLVAVLSLGLGIGVNTTIFSAVDVFLIRPLPYPDADRVMQVWTANKDRGWTSASVSLADALDWRNEAKTIDLAAYTGGSFNLTGFERPERISTLRVAHNFFRVIGVAPRLGRAFTSEEEVQGNNRVVIVSDPFWRTQLASDPGVLGRTLMLNGSAHTVVGVMPPDFQFNGPEYQMWAPLGIPAGGEPRDSRYFAVIGRLRTGATETTAAAELAEVARRLELASPATNRGMGVSVKPLRKELFDEDFFTASMICTVAVLFVLLIACANVANLLLVRAAAREREIAVRTALGAGRGRIAYQLLTESVILASIGGVLGLVFSVWGIRILVGMMPAWFPMRDHIAISGRVLLYTLALTLGAGVLFGLAPALQATRPNLAGALREGSRGSTVGLRRGRLRSTLVVSEIALALVLMISAGLLVKSAVRVQLVPLGLNPDGIVTVRVALPENTYKDSAQVVQFYQSVVQRVRAMPGVSGAALARCVPLTCGQGTYYSVVGEPEPDPERRPVVQYRTVSPGYFETLAIPLVRGRVFNEQDQHGAPSVVVINEELAKRHWAGRDPIGQRIKFGSGPREIVGVVASTRDFGPDDDPPAIVYFAEYQEAERGMALIARTSTGPERFFPELRRVIGSLDPQLPVYEIRTMAEVLRNQLGGDLIMAKLLGFFAVSALFLAMIGVYGVMSYSVAQRRSELGIRMAIGAERRNILALVVKQGSILAGVGLAIGLAIAFGVTRALASFLYGVSTFDQTIFIGVTVSLALAALAASYGPALRATRVDPIIALRND